MIPQPGMNNSAESSFLLINFTEKIFEQQPKIFRKIAELIVEYIPVEKWIYLQLFHYLTQEGKTLWSSVTHKLIENIFTALNQNENQ